MAIVTGLEKLPAAASQVFSFWEMMLFLRQLYPPHPHHPALLSFLYLGIVCVAYATFIDMNDCFNPAFHQFPLRHSFTKFSLLLPFPFLASVRTQHIYFLVSHIYDL